MSGQSATDLGVAVMARDERGAPRLIRAILPRTGLAGATPEAIARGHVAALAPLWVGSAAPVGLVETGTQQLRNGSTVVQLAQQVGDAFVDRGELRVLLRSDGALAAIAGTLMPAAAVSAARFTSTPSQALVHAIGPALDKQLGARPALAIREAAEVDGWHRLEVAATPELQVSDARARRVLAAVDDQQPGALAPAWEVEAFTAAAPDPLSESTGPVESAHSYLVSDDGRILRDDDLEANDAFLYRVYAEATGNRRPLDGPLADFSPHPTGVPDGSAPGLVPSNLVAMEAFNGPHDKWLADNATTTSGNNAESFADLDGNSAFSAGDIRPDVKSGRVLNSTYDHALEPLATPDQSKAGAVNAFFLVNWMHDWWYDSGFTEATRDGQLDNLGRGGVAGDPLLIAAQAGANAGSRNNASMATPADGARPRMRMFLWTAGADSVLSAPGGVVTSDTFSNGPRTFTVTGDVVIGLDATAPTDDGCQAIGNVTGKIALATYAAQCNSSVTVANAKAAGAIAVILVDGDLDKPRTFGGNAASNLPGLVVGKSDGLALKAQLASGPLTLTLQSTARGPERDGDLDNTVVAHEWGHYLHHRLAVCGASQQCGGMSEGWGDFNALMMMLREGDNRDGVYAEAVYAIGNGSPDTAYFGIRRFPYSRNRTRNDLSFRHIDDQNPLPTATPGFPAGVNSEVHNTGEVWATMMWEALNVLADAHGVDAARRLMSDYVVAGLLMTPTNATFTEARDAILSAASAFDADDMLVMAAAFAGRGLGSCAVSPPRASPTNRGAIESGTLAAVLVAGSTRITDDGPSSNHNGVLEPGESGLIHVALVNSGALAAERVTLTASASTLALAFGAPKTLATVSAFSTVDLTIPITVSPSLPFGASINLFLHVAGDETCDRGGLDILVPFVVGVASSP
jgi:hypothetical protein